MKSVHIYVHQSKSLKAAITMIYFIFYSENQYISKLDKEVQVGKDQDKAQSEKDSHSKNRGGKKLN